MVAEMTRVETAWTMMEPFPLLATCDQAHVFEPSDSLDFEEFLLQIPEPPLHAPNTLVTALRQTVESYEA